MIAGIRTTQELPTPSPIADISPISVYPSFDNFNQQRRYDEADCRKPPTVSCSNKPIVRVNIPRTPPSSSPSTSQTSPYRLRTGTPSFNIEDYNLPSSPAIRASQSDPFNSWPIACYRDLNQNFDFLVNTFGPSTFGYLRNDRGFDIFRPMVQIALSDPAAFHALMIAPVGRRGELYGQQLPGMSALWHRMEALRIVKDRIESGSAEVCLTEGNIFAIMVLMGIGAQWGSINRDEFDPSALNQLILHKGGLDLISRQHPVLEMSIFGMSVLNPGLLRSDLYTLNGLNASVTEDQDMKVLLYGLLGFIRGTAELRQKAPTGLSSIQSAFSPGAPARALLSEAPNHPGIYAHQQQKLRKRLMLHVVLYIFTILLWGSPTVIQEFIMHLQFVLSNAKIWQHSLRLFQWSLAASPSRGTLIFPKQAWQSYELLCAVQALDDQLQDDIVAFYRSILIREPEPCFRSEDLMSRVSTVIFSGS